MNHLYRRRLPGLGGYSKEQARELAALSADMGRQLGLLINRQGRPAMVVVGDADRIVIPDLGRQRQSPGRLRGLRLLHTHLGSGKLSNEDLMDMVFLRLDSVALLNVAPEGHPLSFQWAHLLPSNSRQAMYSVSEVQAWKHADIDFISHAQALEEELSRSSLELHDFSGREKALLISVGQESRQAQAKSLQELEALAQTAGLQVTDSLIQRVKSLNPKYILGKGKLAELEVQALQTGASILVFNQELTPAQMRNLASITERKILDRTQVILDIFAQHASSRAGKLQVELAQLEYTLPRLVGKNRALSRLAGGIGGRGPGETKLELDRRRIRERKTKINKELRNVRSQREATRRRRNQAGLPIVALVGYTNAGKSTLLNVLTQSKVQTADKLFATLDPTSRKLSLGPEQQAIFTDTVGFIRFLPTNLKEAFRATLEELSYADVLLHVADASHPEVQPQIQAVEDILQDMDLGHIPEILALNKWESLDSWSRQVLRNEYPRAVPISALHQKGMQDLIQAVLLKLPATSTAVYEAAY
ncbi:MAG: GTPase HflX [Thermodesulfobacteriota bacterium]